MRAESHHHLEISLAVAIAVLGVTFRVFPLSVSLIAAWDAFALTSLSLAWAGMLSCDARTRVREATLQDSGRITIASCLIIAALASLGGAGTLLSSARAAAEKAPLDLTLVTGHVTLAATTIVLSWLLVHTLLAVHYTHLFYARKKDSAESPPGHGLDFPNEEKPGFSDFAYFSFVIGMTFQVSDVQVTSGAMRRAVLLHSLLSFAFNTVIVAFSINLATTLL